MNAPRAQLLLVEDEAIIALNIAGILESKGYKVVASLSTGQEAVDFVQSRKPDCVLMDIMLRGGMDGIEAAGKIRSIADVPVIYLTAHTDDATLERAKATEPYGYVVKPINQGELFSAIEITLYKHGAEKRIRESEERYRSFVENFQGIAFQGTLDFTPVFFHGAVEAITGYSEDDFLRGKPRWDQIIHPADLALISTSIDLIRRQPGYRTRREYRILREDGEERWVDEYVQNVCDASGRPAAVRGIILDISERKKSQEIIAITNQELNATIEELESTNEEFEAQNRELQQARRELEKSESFLKSLFRAAPVGIGIVTDRVLGWSNETLRQMTGYSEEGLLGRSARLLYPSDEEYEFVGREKYAQIKARGTGTVETRWKRRDGSIIDVLLSSTPLDQKDLSKGVTFTAMDITGRKKAADELMRLTAILEQTSDFVSYSTVEGTIEYINGPGKRMLGYPADMGEKEFKIVNFHPVWAADIVIKTGIPAAIQDGTWTGETALLSREGKEIPVSQVIMAHRSADGALRYISTISRDMSRQKEAEKSLRESEEKLRNIVEHSTNAFYSHTPDHVLTYVSPQFYNILGYSQEEARVRWTGLVTDNPVNTRGYNLTVKALETGERQPPYELELLHRDGHRVFVEVHEAPVVVNGRTVAMVGSLTDITERKKAESALKLSEERYRNLVETMRDGMVVISRENLISYVNPVICEMFGYTKEQLVGTSPLDYLDEKNRAVLVSRLGRRREGRSDVYELEWTRPDGRKVLTQVSPKALYDEAGSFAGSFGVIADITERRRAEELMLQNEKMMTIGGLAAGMAHEINNPLGIILQGVQATQLKISGDYEINRRLAEETGIDLSRMKEYLARSEVLTYLDGISEAGMRAAEIVTSMLQFSRRSSGIKSKTDINDLIDRTIEMASRDYDLKKKYDFKKIVITRNYDRSIPEVGCVPTEIEQVMLNLLKNAAQAMSEKDAPEFVPLISIATAAENGEAVIRISDNGPGIDEYTRKHLFEPFYTTKAPGEGTGLGLAVSFFIISKNHGGTITADSGEGAGTTFTVKLPLED